MLLAALIPLAVLLLALSALIPNAVAQRVLAVVAAILAGVGLVLVLLG